VRNASPHCSTVFQDLTFQKKNTGYKI
jgi:hypothetical protein